MWKCREQGKLLSYVAAEKKQKVHHRIITSDSKLTIVVLDLSMDKMIT